MLQPFGSITAQSSVFRLTVYEKIGTGFMVMNGGT